MVAFAQILGSVVSILSLTVQILKMIREGRGEDVQKATKKAAVNMKKAKSNNDRKKTIHDLADDLYG